MRIFNFLYQNMKLLNLNYIETLFLDPAVPWMSFVEGKRISQTEKNVSQSLAKRSLVRRIRKTLIMMIKFQNQLRILKMGRRPP